MANEELSSWSDLLHSSSKLLEQAAPSAQFPPLQRNLDQLEALSKKLKSKTLRTEAPSQSIAATRLLAREGINAEQLARDLKSFELKTTFEDVFPVEATSVEEYLQQVHEMAMVSAVQEAQKDNLKNFNDYMMKVLEDDWQKEKRDFLQSLSRISTLPRTNMVPASNVGTQSGQLVSMASGPQVSSGVSSMDIVPLSNRPIMEKKASLYAEVVKNLNKARESGLPFKPATAFRLAYESLGIDASGGKSVTMRKIWHLVQMLLAEDSAPQNVSKRMALIIGARRHLEWGHEKYVMDTIQSHPAQAALGGGVGNLQRIRAFLRIRLRDYGVLDFDAGDARRQPPVDTTWQQIYFCLRTGYYDEARNVALSSRASHQFAPLLTEWINTGGMVPEEIAAAAMEECERMLRTGDRVGRAAYDKKKLLLYAIISGSRKHIDRLLRDQTLFSTIEDFLWFRLSALRDCPSGPSSIVLRDADHGILSEGARQKLGVMDAYAEVSTIIRQYGSMYLRLGDLQMALEYYAQAAAAVGGGQLSWTGRGNVDQQRQRSLMLKQLLTEILLRDGGIFLLLGPRGAGEEGQLGRFVTDPKARQQFLIEAACQCQEAGIYDKSIEIQKRVGSFSMALDTINKCLSEAICALFHGRLDGESQTAGLIHSGNEILETYNYHPEVSLQERERVFEQQTVLRQLESILSIHKLARVGHQVEALREIAKLPFLPLDPRGPDIAVDVFENLSPHVQACIPDLLKVALTCLDNVTDSDGSLRALRAKIASFIANNMKRNWPRDLYERVAQRL
ncbi:Nuclear pore complex protein nup93a [Stylosanthes scabra]|uniref:Nuclear pore protein n=2 Tax=Stylosanthes scabra TaxID=79078 RepID=A0ABU6V685_9FABA|nr:Nuclear pore complex protein nup93a [Stylosanthes scabra]